MVDCILTLPSGMSLSSCLSPESDLSDINGVAEDLTLAFLWELKTPAVEQLLENTFPTPDLGKENLTCFSPASVPDAPCDDIPEKGLKVINVLCFKCRAGSCTSQLWLKGQL